MIHCLKTWPVFFDQIKTGVKKFELRENDRNYKLGDELCLQEYDPENYSYTGNYICVKVAYVLHGGQFGLQEGFCIMGFELI